MATQTTSSPSSSVNEATKNETPKEAAPQLVSKDPTSRMAAAEAIIRRNVFWALGAGVIPIPVVDVAAVMAVQLKMLREMSILYDVKFSERIVKKIAYSLLSSLGLVGIGSVIGGSLAKMIPVVGQALGFASVPVLVGSYTHALGRVFVMHLESGGTLLDFDPKAMRSYFKQEFEKAKEVVNRMNSETQKTNSSVT